MEKRKEFIGIDTYNLMYRAFYSNQTELSHNGIPTNAVFTLSQMLLNILKAHNNITYALAVYDGGENVFRKNICTDYKEGRKEMPENLRLQIPLIKDAAEALGFNNYQPDEYEADDILMVLSNRAAKTGVESSLYTSDKDFLQIVQPNLCVINTANSQVIVYTEEKVIEKYGIRPDQIPDYLALCGDSIDNIKGVDKCGPKTASKLLNLYGNIEGIKQNVDQISGLVGSNLKESITNGTLDSYYSLTKTPLDIPVHLKNKDILYKGLNIERWNEFANSLGFNKLILRENRSKPSANQLHFQR